MGLLTDCVLLEMGRVEAMGFAPTRLRIGPQCLKDLVGEYSRRDGILIPKYDQFLGLRIELSQYVKSFRVLDDMGYPRLRRGLA